MKSIACRYALPYAIASGIALGVSLAGLGTLISTQIAIALQKAPTPEAILMLGGNTDREAFTARFALQHPDLDIWVSSGLPRAQASQIFRSAGIERDRLHLDYRAIDTVTNFSTLVDDFKNRNIQHVYLITSEFHMPRAEAIATIILGSQGIVFTPISIPSLDPPESWLRVARDAGRSVLWAFTGHTGATLNPKFHHLKDIAERDASLVPET